ncbi:MAG: hypothetical protein L0J23_01890 [Bifidobacterium crudilactis]|nr:hypothetical protein [Bifidobacterium crudilactis]
MTERDMTARPRKVAEYRGEEARERAAQVLMEMTGAPDVGQAQDVLLGRPRLRKGEETVQVHFKATREMATWLAEQRKRSGMRYTSEYLRMLVERDMDNHASRHQTAQPA